MPQTVKRYGVHLSLLATFLMGFGTASLLGSAPASAGVDLGDLLGDVLKIGGVKIAVDEFGDELNSFINTFMDNNDASTDSASKVVTIISPIGNKHIGAAQVVGSEEAVAKVGAVVQLETSFMNKLFRIKAMIPIEGMSASGFTRVPGVGVSAVIDVKI